MSSGATREAFAAVESVLTGALAGCRPALVAPGTGDDIVLAESLLEGPHLRAALDGFAGSFAEADQRAVVSLWSCWYLGILVPPAVAACALLENPPALGLRDVGFCLAPGGAVASVRFNRLERRTGDPHSRLSALVTDHLAPFVDALTRHGRLSRNIAWGNAASYFHWAAVTLASQSGVADAEAFLHSPLLADGTANPFHGRLREIEEDGAKIARRRTCCLRYLLPGGAKCEAACPL